MLEHKVSILLIGFQSIRRFLSVLIVLDTSVQDSQRPGKAVSIREALET